MTESISGKVARVTSDRELIINRGSEHAVRPGTIFKVKGPGFEVTDPETGEDIGVVSPVKVFVRAEEVGPKFSIARTFREKTYKVSEAIEGGPGYNSVKGIGLSGMFQPPAPARWETEVETLRLDPSAGEPLNEDDSVVQVGDTVESVAPDEDVDQVTFTVFR